MSDLSELVSVSLSLSQLQRWGVRVAGAVLH